MMSANKFRLEMLILTLATLLPTTTAMINCWTACKNCKENTNHPEIVDVYCSMCLECRKRRSWMRNAQENADVYKNQPIEFPPGCPTPPPCDSSSEGGPASASRAPISTETTPILTSSTCPPIMLYPVCIKKRRPRPKYETQPYPPQPYTTRQYPPQPYPPQPYAPQPYTSQSYLPPPYTQPDPPQSYPPQPYTSPQYQPQPYPPQTNPPQPNPPQTYSPQQDTSKLDPPPQNDGKYPPCMPCVPVCPMPCSWTGMQWGSMVSGVSDKMPFNMKSSVQSYQDKTEFSYIYVGVPKELVREPR